MSSGDDASSALWVPPRSPCSWGDRRWLEGASAARHLSFRHRAAETLQQKVRKHETCSHVLACFQCFFNPQEVTGEGKLYKLFLLGLAVVSTFRRKIPCAESGRLPGVTVAAPGSEEPLPPPRPLSWPVEDLLLFLLSPGRGHWGPARDQPGVPGGRSHLSAGKPSLSSYCILRTCVFSYPQAVSRPVSRGLACTPQWGRARAEEGPVTRGPRPASFAHSTQPPRRWMRHVPAQQSEWGRPCW